MRLALVVFAAAVCAGVIWPARAASRGDISGKWHFIIQTDDGDRIFEPVFHLEGNKVTGKWGNDDVQGTFEDSKLNLEFPATSEEVGKGTLKINGQLTGEGLDGTWSFQTYSGTFKATRVP